MELREAVPDETAVAATVFGAHRGGF